MKTLRALLVSIGGGRHVAGCVIVVVGVGLVGGASGVIKIHSFLFCIHGFIHYWQV